jgi:hypothetical protein
MKDLDPTSGRLITTPPSPLNVPLVRSSKHRLRRGV